MNADAIKAKIPAHAKAIIFAELEEDNCDGMTDYYNTKTTARVVLGWSKHTRDLFSEMRKHAARYPETAHLATKREENEHREKYSMGKGYYLKASGCFDSGWIIRKFELPFALTRIEADTLDAIGGWTPTPEPAIDFAQVIEIGSQPIETGAEIIALEFT